VLTKLSIGHFLLRFVFGWLRHFTPKLHYTKNAHYSGVIISMKNKKPIIYFVFMLLFSVYASRSPAIIGVYCGFDDLNPPVESTSD